MADWKQRGTGSSISAGDDEPLDFSSGFTADELEVAGILVHLSNLIKKSESHHRFPAFWGAKKKRSVKNTPESDSPAPASELRPITDKVEDVSTSPTSPLDFPSLTDSDSKLLRPNNKVSASLKGELLKQCERLQDMREQLKKEVKKVEAYRDELKAENIILQERRQQVSQYMGIEEAQLKLPFTQSQPLVPSGPQPHHQRHPLMVFPYQHAGPSDIPDLNISPEEYAGALEYPQPLNLEYHHHMAAKAESRAAAALARRNRSLIQKAKSFNRAPRGSR